jgi:spore coat protein JC
MAMGNGGIDMWTYEKQLEYPIKIRHPNPAAAKVILTQYGGPDGEAGAALRYLSQRYTMPYKQAIGVLNDIGTEELAHLEMVSTIVHQLTRGMTMEQIKESGFDTYFVDHTAGIWPQAASGVPFSSAAFQSKGDAITDLVEDMAAEQKARTTYDNILRLVDDPDVKEPIRFLREREIVHFQRFGEALRVVQDNLNSKNFYAFNPEFDRPRQR